MRVETYSCDVCQKQKKDANRWWRISLITNGDAGPSRRHFGLVVTKFEIDLPGDKLASGVHLERESAHVCGEECAMKYISKKLFNSAN